MKSRLNELFLQFDSDQDHALSYDEMSKMLGAMKDTFPQLEVYHNKVKKLFDDFDADGDGRAFCSCIKLLNKIKSLMLWLISD